MAIEKQVTLTTKITAVNIITDGDRTGSAEIAYKTSVDGVQVSAGSKACPADAVLPLLMALADGSETIYENVAKAAYKLIE